MPILEYLFFRPGPPGPIFDRWGGVLFGALVSLGLGICLLCAVMYELNSRHVLNRSVARQILLWGGGLQLVGLVLLGLRVANWPVLSMRVLLYAFLIAEVCAAVYLWWWVKNRYPPRLAAYELGERRRSYLPRAEGGAVESMRRRSASRRRR